MFRKIFVCLSAALTCSILSAANPSTTMPTCDSIPEVSHIPVDTLLNVSKASDIDIHSDGSSIQITVKGLNDTDDNFYYDTHARKDMATFSHFRIKCGNISDVLVVETANNVKVSYQEAEGTPQSYNFSFADPENRSQKSYIGKKWSDFAISLSDRNAVKWQIVTRGLSLGWVTPTCASPSFDASMGRSIEASWLMVMGVEMRYRSLAVATGLGVEGRNFVTKGDRYFKRNPDGRISLEPYADYMTDRRSRINVFSLEVPVLCTLSFGPKDRWGVTFGPVINFNTSANIKTQYKVGDESYSIKSSGIAQAPVTVDALLSVHYNGIGLYARYSPMDVLKNSTAMDFGAFSTGITLLF